MKSAHRAFSLIELLVTVSIISLLAALLMPAISAVRSSAQAVRCLSNLRQIGLGMGCYAADNRGMVPPPNIPVAWGSGYNEWGWWQGFIAPYLPGKSDRITAMDVFWCPRATWKYSQRPTDIRGNATSYGMNQAVNGVNGIDIHYYRLAKLRSTSRTILVSERWAHPNSAPGYGGVSNGIIDAPWFREVMDRDSGQPLARPPGFAAATNGSFESSPRVSHRGQFNLLAADFSVAASTPWTTCGPASNGNGAWNMWSGR